MSVNKLYNAEYMYLALSIKENEQLCKSFNILGIDASNYENIYNLCRNLNVLGLCERYDDLFLSCWEKDKKEECNDLYNKYVKNNEGLESECFKNNFVKDNPNYSFVFELMEGFGYKNLFEDKWSYLHGNSYNNCSYNALLYDFFNGDDYKKAMEYLNTPHSYIPDKYNNKIRYYQYNVLNVLSGLKEDSNKNITDLLNEIYVNNKEDFKDGIDKENAAMYSKCVTLYDLARNTSFMTSFVDKDSIKNRLLEDNIKFLDILKNNGVKIINNEKEKGKGM